MTEEDENHFRSINICHICEKEIVEEEIIGEDEEEIVAITETKVRDYDHLTGKYRGPAHIYCNLKYKLPNFIPIFRHNLSGYDAHLFIRSLGKYEENIEVIPCTEEKYLSFSQAVPVFTEGDKTTKIKLRFLDSFRFMPSSLDALSKNLKREQFSEVSKFIPDEKLDLLIRKGVYPYDYKNSWDKCIETSLPPKEAFYSELNECDISDEDYKHAQNVWGQFGIKSMGEYSDLYVKSDVLILADVFEKFRDVCLKAYKLHPAWYFTTPGLSWDAMLKLAKVRLEQLVDYDMILMLEKGVRCGVSQC
ncbi:hypothetical protein AVEN_175950-1 [Araneus ventricosus]|uniref:DNA-directed DNA polymerase n=1 Tax=Araneus ventricosus TaxID=182803 RepID=A0A4Y2G8N6_ARAVE|nr:hypothetical protein AVEN_175950-1 [Araneus ventricosus]